MSLPTCPMWLTNGEIIPSEVVSWVFVGPAGVSIVESLKPSLGVTCPFLPRVCVSGAYVLPGPLSLHTISFTPSIGLDMKQAFTPGKGGSLTLRYCSVSLLQNRAREGFSPSRAKQAQTRSTSPCQTPAWTSLFSGSLSSCSVTTLLLLRVVFMYHLPSYVVVCILPPLLPPVYLLFSHLPFRSPKATQKSLLVFRQI